MTTLSRAFFHHCYSTHEATQKQSLNKLADGAQKGKILIRQMREPQFLAQPWCGISGHVGWPKNNLLMGYFWNGVFQ